MSRHISLLLAAIVAPALTVTMTAAPAFAAPVKHAQHVSHQAPQKKAPKKKPGTKHGKPAALTCHATMTNGRPYQFTTTTLTVNTTGGALVQATAHYWTTTVPEGAMASKRGAARIPFYISLSTPWYRVGVTVQVTKGSQHASCSTSFVPRLL